MDTVEVESELERMAQKRGPLVADGELQREPETKPNPDPTIATNEAVERAMKSERDYVDGKIEVLLERLRGIDTATKLLNDTASQVPDDIAQGVHHLRELTEGRFATVDNQFSERDIRQERESRDNVVKVDAAFAAQKESALKQDESNAKAIDKSERATAETIKTNQELAKSTTDALTKSLDELKLQVSKSEAIKQGGREAVTDRRETTSNTTTIIASVVAASVFAVALFTAVQASRNQDARQPPAVVTVTTPTP